MYNTVDYRKEIDEMIIKIALRKIDNSRYSVYNYISRHFDYLTIREQSNILLFNRYWSDKVEGVRNENYSITR